MVFFGSKLWFFRGLLLHFSFNRSKNNCLSDDVSMSRDPAVGFVWSMLYTVCVCNQIDTLEATSRDWSAFPALHIKSFTSSITQGTGWKTSNNSSQTFVFMMVLCSGVNLPSVIPPILLQLIGNSTGFDDVLNVLNWQSLIANHGVPYLNVVAV